MYLQSKDKFVNIFQTWLSAIKNQYSKFMKTFCANRKKEFILTKLKDLYNKKNITIKYTTLYIYKKTIQQSKDRKQL